MTRIHPLCTANLHELVLLEDRCFSGAWSQSQLLAHLEHLRAISLGVFAPDLVGFILLSTLFDEAELLQVAVVPECRGEGLAQQLMTASLPLLEERNITRLLLEVRESNMAARSLYKRFGFIEDGRRKGYYTSLEPSNDREDALLLSLALESE